MSKLALYLLIHLLASSQCKRLVQSPGTDDVSTYNQKDRRDQSKHVHGGQKRTKNLSIDNALRSRRRLRATEDSSGGDQTCKDQAHIVAAGESLDKITTLYKQTSGFQQLDIRTLCCANNQSEGVSSISKCGSISIGQTILIPCDGTTTSSCPAVTASIDLNQGCSTITKYKVAPGDSLEEIAKQQGSGLNSRQICCYNPSISNCSKIAVDQDIFIPCSPEQTTEECPAVRAADNQAANVCDKCNLTAAEGGCKCDKNCDCLPKTGGAVCDKCDIPVADGGCKCDENCACLTGAGAGGNDTSTCPDYQVEPNDQLSTVVLKDPYNKLGITWQQICCNNPQITNCSIIQTGQTLKIPCNTDATTDCPGLQATEGNNNNGANVGLIVGATLGSLAVVGLMAGLVVWYMRRYRRQQQARLDGVTLMGGDEGDQGQEMAKWKRATGDKYIWKLQDGRKLTDGCTVLFGQQAYGSAIPVAGKFFRSRSTFNREAEFYKRKLDAKYFPQVFDIVAPPAPSSEVKTEVGGAPSDSLDATSAGCIVMEKGMYMLFDWMYRPAVKPGILEMKAVVHRVAEGLQYLHERRLVHGDLKPQNIMFFGDNSTAYPGWKLIDCGSWQTIGDSAVPHYSLRYSAPEVVAAAVAQKPLVAQSAADMWSLGVIMWECLTGSALFQGMDDKQVLECLQGKAQLPFETNPTMWLSIKRSQALMVVKNLLHRDPQARWDVSKVLHSGYLNDHTVVPSPSMQHLYNKLDDLSSQVKGVELMTLDVLKAAATASLVVSIDMEELDVNSLCTDPNGKDDAAKQTANGHLDTNGADDVNDDGDDGSGDDDADSDMKSCGSVGRPSPEELLLDYECGMLRAREVPLSLIEDQQTFKVRVGRVHIIHVCLMYGEGSSMELPVSSVQHLWITPDSDQNDKVLIPIEPAVNMCTSHKWHGIGVWDMSLHACPRLNIQPSVLCRSAMTVRLHMACPLKSCKADPVYLAQDVSLQLCKSNAQLAVDRAVPALLQKWEQAPEWMKLGVKGAIFFYNLRRDALG